MRAIRSFACFAAVLGVASAVTAQQPPPAADCTSPRGAAITWLGNLQEGTARPSVAIECFDWGGAGVSGGDRAEYARKLKAAIDARGIWVEVDELPSDDEVLDEDDTPVDRVYLVSEDVAGEFYFVRKNDRWVMSASSIRAIPAYHADTFDVDVEAFVETLPAWTKERTLFGLAWWQWIAIGLALLLAFVVRKVVAYLVSTYGSRLLRRRGDKFDATIVQKAGLPIGTLAMAGVLWYVLPLLRFSVRVNQVVLLSIRVLAAVAAVVVLYRVVDLISDIFARRAQKTDTKLDDQLIPLIRKTIKVFVVIVGVIFVLQNMSVDVTSLLALGTVGSLAFSFAAKDTVANLFGSISIFTDRPFQIGDWVVIGDTEGIIEEVGMRSTRIRTFYNSVVTVPNSIITVTPVDNYGVREFRRTSVTLNLTYDTTPEQMEAFCDGVRGILAANPAVRKDVYEVHFKGFGAASLDVMLYFFFKVSSWSDELRQRHLIYLEILRLARDLGVEFAFPTQTLHLESVAEPKPPPPHRAPPDEELTATVIAFGPGGERGRPGGPTVGKGFWAGTPQVLGPVEEDE